MIGRGSLKLRLFAAAGLAISISLLVAGLSFYFIFQRYVERQAIAELDNHFVQLIASIRIDDAGKLRARTTLSDPRFQKPYGGLYWQINETGQAPLRSRSLFDEVLAAPPIGKITENSDSVHIIVGPNSSKLFASEKNLVLPLPGNGERKLEITMAVDRKDIDATVKSFGNDLISGMGLLYLVLLGASFLQVTIGLRPLESLRRGVETIRLGTAKNIVGAYPIEVSPLVEEVNGLLSERADQLERARQRASNLAHGLKTPLTVMSTLAENISAAGLKNEARDIQDGADQMRTLVERELARARMASGHGAQLTNILPIVSKMIRALTKTTENTALLWRINVPDDAQIAMEPGDLLELVGNLLDNARKWAKTKVQIGWTDGKLTIEDDGPGVPKAQMSKIQERGVRLDEKVSGTGLGLGIVRDLAEVYNFDLEFGRSNLGGLSVSINSKPQPLRMERPA
jgi:signal transduction histidine kinase